MAIARHSSHARLLGLLASTLSRWEDAAGHFEDALTLETKLRARPALARTQYEYARMLLARGEANDRDKALGLLARAIEGARALGMPRVADRALALQHDAEGASPPAAPSARSTKPPASAGENRFRCGGDVWTIAYEGSSFQLRDSKGLQYIAHLLRHEGQEFHAADLAAGAGAAVPLEHEAEGEVASGLGDAGEVLDAPARAAYRQRLQDLEAELAEATQWADRGRAEKLREELEFLREELSAAYGLGGRGRKAADVGDRARKAVTSRIRESIDRIETEHPALARHFANAIHTGTFCSYQPDRALRWEL